MLRSLIVGIALLTACGGSEDAPAASASPTAAKDAGKVLEVAGTVTATRGGVTRVLATGYLVSADDVIDTAKDGSVVIELFHNNARWSLEAGLKTRVDESVAWGLPKQDAAASVDHASSAAGRHADRQAADTSVSYKKKTSVDFPDDTIEGNLVRPNPAIATPTAPRPGGPAGDNRATTKPKTTTTAPTTKPESKDSGDATNRPKLPPAGGGCDEVSCVVGGYQGACCSKFKKGGGGGGGAANKPSPASDLPETLGRQDISTAMAKARAKIITCSTDPNLKGTLKVAVKVGADGSVTSAEVKQSFEPTFDACAVAIIKALKFPPSKTGVTFSYPIVIN